MHLREHVPGLWPSFPQGIELEVDEGRLQLSWEFRARAEPETMQRLAAAFGRVLEANAPDRFRAIASADADWERGTSAVEIPRVVVGGGAAAPAGTRRRGLGGLAWAIAPFAAGFWMMAMMALTGLDHGARGWLVLSCGCGLVFFGTPLVLWRSRWVLYAGLLTALSVGGYFATEALDGKEVIWRGPSGFPLIEEPK
jgi:hypothetical protein